MNREGAVGMAVVAAQDAGRACGEIAAAIGSTAHAADDHCHVLRGRLKNALQILLSAQDAVQQALAELEMKKS